MMCDKSSFQLMVHYFNMNSRKRKVLNFREFQRIWPSIGAYRKFRMQKVGNI